MSLPLTLPAYIVSPTCTIQVVVNPNYYTATVNFNSGPTTVYSLVVLQQAPEATLPPDLVVGDATFTSGNIYLQIPSPVMQGAIKAVLKGTAGRSPLNINATIASWNLNQ
jgi:hypothetical protein